MKNFTVLVMLFLLNLAAVSPGFAMTGGDCGCTDSENGLKNGSFESGTNNWSKTEGTDFQTNRSYNVCGDKNGVINGSGIVYQVVDLAGGSQVNLSVYGGTHNAARNHQFKINFYTSDNRLIEGRDNRVEIDMNYQVTDSRLRQYNASITAPANAAKVVFSIVSGGDYFKFDVACLTITPPAPSDCGCPDDQNAIKNGSFESGTDHWSKSEGTNFISEPPYSVCGHKNGLITGHGTIFQEVNVTQGSVVNVKVFGGTHDTGLNHQFKLEFYNSAGALVAIEINDDNTRQMDYRVTQLHKLQEYNLSATAPLGAVKVRFSVISGGNYFKIDGVCMGITPPPTPVCETCNNNKLTNASFEEDAAGWETTGNVIANNAIANCGEKSLILSGSSTFRQDVPMLPTYGNTVTLIFWGAVLEDRDQKVEIVFLDGSSKVLGTLTQQIDKLVNSSPWGLERYTLSGAVPQGTEVVRVQGSQSDNYLAIDGTCLTFAGPPLPVTLASFNAKKEGNTASLVWTTTFESNSDHFDVQHSGDGKNWKVLTSIQAQGESADDVTYTYTHTNPFAINLYRLKMVDADGTFAFSEIKSLNFDAAEQMNIYPNPAVDRIKFEGAQQINNVKVYNQNGVLILNTKPDAANEVDLTRLVQGTYFVKVNDGAVTRKILVVR
ncbi:T9SS type A sorting domain-containing protein [Dyadobacter sp. CY343]|uniref:T9SS type A sorting domain-containing protein n=1 Tax=Dyadobacter sp. CY343 TaxID=2907299 RepID=UPI001F438E9F|nr:T9SS type A sorting domain-containing protein [Dyadobacter sp. CY343]MCE7058877.1 T9SS type A sorting domain-containing protein [Dyadobacter sp. CY343]